jgi:cell fate (sporulation/competence/biofilm development) regulator YmcA (YheA/YmcA/DUF963 family)
LENLEERNKFLDTYQIKQGDINNLNRSITSNVTEEIIKSLTKKKSPGLDEFTVEFTLKNN